MGGAESLLLGILDALAVVTSDLTVGLEDFMPQGADSVDQIVLSEHSLTNVITSESLGHLGETRVGRESGTGIVVRSGDVLVEVSVELRGVEVGVADTNDVIGIQRGSNSTLGNGIIHGHLATIQSGNGNLADGSIKGLDLLGAGYAWMIGQTIISMVYVGFVRVINVRIMKSLMAV